MVKVSTSSLTISGMEIFDGCLRHLLIFIPYHTRPQTFAGNLNAAARDGRIVNLASLSGPTFKPGM